MLKTYQTEIMCNKKMGLQGLHVDSIDSILIPPW